MTFGLVLRGLFRDFPGWMTVRARLAPRTRAPARWTPGGFGKWLSAPDVDTARVRHLREHRTALLSRQAMPGALSWPVRALGLARVFTYLVNRARKGSA